MAVLSAEAAIGVAEIPVGEWQAPDSAHHALTVPVVAVLLALLAKKRKKSAPATRDPLAEAEVFLAYGRKKEAKAVLESHLRASPNDAKAMQLLRRANDSGARHGG